MSKVDFLKTFIKDRDVASITPTSLHCIKKICANIDFSKDFTLVEFGPGDGVFTRYILKKMTPASRIILIEANENFVDHLKKTLNDPRIIVHENVAANVEQLLADDDIGNIDYVLSGIPFSFLKKDRKYAVLEAIKAVLKPGGLFLAYQTTGHLKKPVMEVFGNLETKREMLNLPPYLVYKVVKYVN